jgi:hypothetical protein
MQTHPIARLAAAPLAAAFLLASLPACVTRIGTTDPAEASDAAGPFPDGYEAIVRRWLEKEIRVLAQIEEFAVERPVRGFSTGAPIFGSRTDGWRTSVRAAGRDSVGMSTGAISYALLLRDGKVVEHQKLLR